MRSTILASVAAMLLIMLAMLLGVVCPTIAISYYFGMSSAMALEILKVQALLAIAYRVFLYE